MRSTASSPARYCMNPVAALIASQPQSRIPALARPPCQKHFMQKTRCRRLAPEPLRDDFQISGFSPASTTRSWHQVRRHMDEPVRRQEAARGMQDGNLRSFGMMLDGRLPTTSIRRCGEDATLLIVLNAHDDNCPVHPPGDGGRKAWQWTRPRRRSWERACPGRR
jgi:hypothetical protein